MKTVIGDYQRGDSCLKDISGETPIAWTPDEPRPEPPEGKRWVVVGDGLWAIPTTFAPPALRPEDV